MNLCFFRPACLPLLILCHVGFSQTGFPDRSPPASPEPQFQYQRAVKLAVTGREEQACAVLDAAVFAHAAASLKDLRLYSGRDEIPYATTLSEPLLQETEDARILNLRSQSGHVLFDLEMPQRPYTGVQLDLAADDYIAKVLVSGSASASGRDATQLGNFTLFDLSSQRLSHNTSIPLSESNFPYLHLDLVLTPAPGSSGKSVSLNIPAIVKAVTVPPSREAQSLYTTAQRPASLVQRGQETVAIFKVQARVPIERIVFALPPSFRGSFSRTVRIDAKGIPDGATNSQKGPDGSAASFGIETVTGSILRVHRSEAGREISAESLDIPVSIGSNMQQPAEIDVAVDNGPDAPLPLTAELQMRQRRICFDTRSATGPLTLYYGDPSLDAPAYNDAALSQAAANPRTAALGPESHNAFFTTPLPSRRLGQHHPVLRWVALLGCVCIFALLVFRRSAKHRPR